MWIGSVARCLVIATLSGWGLSVRAQAAEMTVTADGRSLVVTGIIQEWDHCHAARLLDAHPGIRQVRINSHGGYAWAGAYLGRLFGWAGLEAVVPEGAVAESAAGIAVIGAAQRVIEGKVGLHGPWLTHPTSSTMARAILAETAEEMASVLTLGGMPPDRINRAMKTGQDRLYIIDKAAMASFHHQGHPDPDKIRHVAAVCRSIFHDEPDIPLTDRDATAARVTFYTARPFDTASR